MIDVVGIDHVQLSMPTGGEAEARRFAEAGVPTEDDDSGLPVRRCYIRDPFGNRIELVDARDAAFSETAII